MAAKKLAPVHPGQFPPEEPLEPMDVSQYRLSKDIGVRPRHINEITYGKWAVSPDTAPLLPRYFGMSGTFWSNLQSC